MNAAGSFCVLVGADIAVHNADSVAELDLAGVIRL